MTHVLLLGGTTGASQLARALHQAGVPAVFSYAGVTQAPLAQPLPVRVGGFGGVRGLVQYMADHGITHVVDATHPFAAQMSLNAIEACAAAGIPLLALERPAWAPVPGDQWTEVPDMAAAAQALQPQHRRVFLAIGRKQLAAFSSAPDHDYLLRVVDPLDEAPALPRHHTLVARGPFALADELAMLRAHAIDCVVSKNAGGPDTYAKIEAARLLQLPVILVARPALPERTRCETPAQAMQWLASC